MSNPYIPQNKWKILHENTVLIGGLFIPIYTQMGKYV